MLLNKALGSTFSLIKKYSKFTLRQIKSLCILWHIALITLSHFSLTASNRRTLLCSQRSFPGTENGHKMNTDIQNAVLTA